MSEPDERPQASRPETRMPSHAAVCDVFGVEHFTPAPSWLPYASRATKIEVVINGARQFVFGGGMRCGSCGYGVDIRPGPGTQHPDPAGRVRCPRCGYGVPSAVSSQDTPK